MHIIRNPHTLPAALKSPVVAIGNFDGVHLGHRAVLSESQRVAKEKGAPLLALTFHPHPRMFFQGRAAPLAIEGLRIKAAKMQALGVDGLVVLRFTAALAAMRAEDFVKNILVDALSARHVVTGEDFAFGAKRGGNAEFLHVCADKFGFGYSAVCAVKMLGEACSSTRIRAYLAGGDVVSAAQLLGEPYAMTGRVAHGEARGRELGFPTANIVPHALFLPTFGVYAAKVSGPWEGEKPAILNIGVKPTFGGTRPVLEAHLLDFKDDLYGARLTLKLTHFVRPEQTFPSLEALKKQIHTDITHVRNLL